MNNMIGPPPLPRGVATPDYFSHVNWNKVNNWARINNIPFPATLHTISLAYFSRRHSTPTFGVMEFMDKEWKRQKEEGQNKTILQLSAQQKVINTNLAQLQRQYNQLSSAYIAATQANQQSGRQIKELKDQLDAVIKLLQEVGLM